LYNIVIDNQILISGRWTKVGWCRCGSCW